MLTGPLLQVTVPVWVRATLAEGQVELVPFMLLPFLLAEFLLPLRLLVRAGGTHRRVLLHYFGLLLLIVVGQLQPLLLAQRVPEPVLPLPRLVPLLRRAFEERLLKLLGWLTSVLPLSQLLLLGLRALKVAALPLPLVVLPPRPAGVHHPQLHVHQEQHVPLRQCVGRLPEHVPTL